MRASTGTEVSASVPFHFLHACSRLPAGSAPITPLLHLHVSERRGARWPKNSRKLWKITDVTIRRFISFLSQSFLWAWPWPSPFFYHFRESDSRDNFHAFLLIVLAVAFLVLAFKERLYSLKVQDRVIRLEKRLRLQQLLPETLRSRIPELTVEQLCGLRFASDAEVAALRTARSR